jgi:hypothetical protein
VVLEGWHWILVLILSHQRQRVLPENRAKFASCKGNSTGQAFIRDRSNFDVIAVVEGTEK